MGDKYKERASSETSGEPESWFVSEMGLIYTYELGQCGTMCPGLPPVSCFQPPYLNNLTSSLMQGGGGDVFVSPVGCFSLGSRSMGLTPYGGLQTLFVNTASFWEVGCVILFVFL